VTRGQPTRETGKPKIQTNKNMTTENSNLTGSATYSPEDNKLRLSFATRLPKELYERVRASGFFWAPKQEIFVAPMWTPARESLAVELCGEIGDEDKSLVERAEERADRFDDYSASRADDADRAHKAVETIAGGIPFGQPLLVGHHSEKHARRDAEKIENGMRRAVKMWETSVYWTQRAAGAIRAAKYKERPDVRARRIKGIEADKRKQERARADAEKALRFWRGEMKLVNRATGEKLQLVISEENRAEIHKLLGGALGDPCGRFNVVQREGGASWEGWSAWNVLEPDETRYKACPACTVEQCRVAAEQAFTREIERCQRWINHYENRLTYERAMLADAGGIATDKTGPEKGGACRCWASPTGGWSYIQKVNKVSVTVFDNWGNGNGNFPRTIPFDKCFHLMTAAQVQAARDCGNLVEMGDKTGFALRGSGMEAAAVHALPDKTAEAEKGAAFDAMKDTLKAGVQVVSAPQLFPTPREMAGRMAETADLFAGEKVLEPSAGTGNLIEAIISQGIFKSDICAVEINKPLADKLQTSAGRVVCGDFLEQNGNLGKFDKIIMNPPFGNGADIQHILHARKFLNPGGLIVALCANGPRQREALQPIAASWEDLPAGSFKESGTGVNVALLTIKN